jgi:hypothetical protein
VTAPLSPDGLRHLLATASGGPATGDFETFFETAARYRRRRRIVAAATVAVLVAATTILVPVLAVGGGSPRPASPSPTPAPTSPAVTHRTTGLLDETVISSSPTRLVLQSPPLRIRWTLNSFCGVSYRYLYGMPVNAGGSAGGGCPFASDLSIGTTASFGSHGKLYDLVGGRVSPAQGVTVKVTLVDGETMSYTPRQSFWLAVDQRCGDYAGTALHSVTAVAGDGEVLAHKTLPAERATSPALPMASPATTSSTGIVTSSTPPDSRLICAQAHTR